jgi:hypothetical protein
MKLISIEITFIEEKTIKPKIKTFFKNTLIKKK